jgi:hypothetical protein
LEIGYAKYGGAYMGRVNMPGNLFKVHIEICIAEMKQASFRDGRSAASGGFGTELLSGCIPISIFAMLSMTVGK